LPRFTLASYHEAALAKMPATLRAVEELGVRVQLLDRRGTVLHDSRDGPSTAVDMLASLRARPLQRTEAERLAEGWSRLRSELDRAGVPDIVRAGVRHEHHRFMLLLQRSRGLER
jgi:hypothetical protein